MIHEEVLLDAIPLTELMGIELMEEDCPKGKLKLQRSLSEITVENVIDFSKAFQIRTKKNGYNAGRKYLVQAESDETLSFLMAGIPNLSREARLRAEAKPLLARVQGQVRAMYSSTWFQGIASFLIMAVSPSLRTRPAPHPDRTDARPPAELRSHNRRGAAAAGAALHRRRLPDPAEADTGHHQPELHRHLRRRAQHQPLRPLVLRLLLQQLVRLRPPSNQRLENYHENYYCCFETAI